MYKPKFKVGDLIQLVDPISFADGNRVIPSGAIGLILTSMCYGDEHNCAGYDYIVLVDGEEIIFFEEELVALHT